MSDSIDWNKVPLSEMLYEAADQLAGDAGLFDMLLVKAKALEEDAKAIDELLGCAVRGLTNPAAVKWLHDLYSEQCDMLQKCARQHRIGLGGECVSRVVCEELDRMKKEYEPT